MNKLNEQPCHCCFFFFLSGAEKDVYKHIHKWPPQVGDNEWKKKNIFCPLVYKTIQMTQITHPQTAQRIVIIWTHPGSVSSCCIQMWLQSQKPILQNNSILYISHLSLLWLRAQWWQMDYHRMTRRANGTGVVGSHVFMFHCIFVSSTPQVVTKIKTTGKTIWGFLL